MALQDAGYTELFVSYDGIDIKRPKEKEKVEEFRCSRDLREWQERFTDGQLTGYLPSPMSFALDTDTYQAYMISEEV